MTLTEYLGASPDLLDEIARAVADKARRVDRGLARVQWATFTAAGVRARGGASFAVEDFESLPPSPEELRERAERRKAEEKAAEAQFLAQTKAWIASRRSGRMNTTNHGK